jgi:hypothetical protein
MQKSKIGPAQLQQLINLLCNIIIITRGERERIRSRNIRSKLIKAIKNLIYANIMSKKETEEEKNSNVVLL